MVAEHCENALTYEALLVSRLDVYSILKTGETFTACTFRDLVSATVFFNSPTTGSSFWAASNWS